MTEGVIAVAGWLIIIAGFLFVIFSLFDNSSDVAIFMGFASGCGVVVVGLLLLGIATVILKLCEVEHHLFVLVRLQVKIHDQHLEPEKPNSDSALVG